MIEKQSLRWYLMYDATVNKTTLRNQPFHEAFISLKGAKPI